MERLYDLFQSAPDLGSRINPHTVTEDFFALGFDTLKGTVERALKKIEARGDPDRAALGVAAQWIALAATLMSRQFTLVATNVPYLARGKQAEELRKYIEDVHPVAKADLATVFLERCLAYCAPGGTTALVTPQNWLFLGSYKALREQLLRRVAWNAVAKLGENGFDSPQAAGAFTPDDLAAIWTFCSSQELAKAVRLYNQKTSIDLSLRFELQRWGKITAQNFPSGLPEPRSSDSTQWLFKGHPKGSTDPLQVAVARLLDFRWPDQVPDDLDALADADGIVPMSSVRGEPPAAERLREILRAAFDRGRKDRLSSVPPPSEPCMRISRTRLSSQWFYLEED
jgi:hypothetical protein